MQQRRHKSKKPHLVFYFSLISVRTKKKTKTHNTCKHNIYSQSKNNTTPGHADTVTRTETGERKKVKKLLRKRFFFFLNAPVNWTTQHSSKTTERESKNLLLFNALWFSLSLFSFYQKSRFLFFLLALKLWSRSSGSSSSSSVKWGCGDGRTDNGNGSTKQTQQQQCYKHY